MTDQVLLEDVFKRSGVPTYTFVEPLEYEKLLVGLRTPGRGVVIEGPSGIGKTTAVERALQALKLTGTALTLSARKPEDVELISALPGIRDAGVVVIDDFHRLPVDLKAEIADYLKTLADEGRREVKLIVVGINRAGDTLVSLAPDLNNRIETIRFEANPDELVEKMISLGEEALNVRIGIRDDIVAASAGSFYLAQMLCHETCIQSKVLERPAKTQTLAISYEVVLDRVNTDLERVFLPVAIEFASGTRLKREGRAPYLNLLKWLAEANDWSIVIDREITKHPTLKGSVGQVVDKGFLEGLIASSERIQSVIHFDPQNGVLGVEDPQFVFFLRNILWNKLAERVGFIDISFDRRYDIALSFAGSDRDDAALLFDLLSGMEFEVFYDKNEQARILAENIEDYLGPIYRSEAYFVVALLGPDYPKRIWTKFESDQFRERFGEGSIVPVWYSSAPPGVFDESGRVGGFALDVDGDVPAQLTELAGLLREKVGEMRRDGSASS